ncbi:hypothetical protein H4Q32_030857 [Labeo rohita]|uniref:Reverse transcriptase n=1 Tax=Labeo rohita TaxID=84645 RepID=A0ABQ8KYP2_LABRO|nr:hypothetical protein H4Q32_030857 [Labeo rohita]
MREREEQIGGTILNHVTCYNYLGLTISASGQFNTAIKDLTDKARRVFYSIRRPLFKFNPSIKLWLKIFDSIIKPILLYGSEIWGPKFKLNYETWDKNPVEIFHLEFCKNILGIHRNAPNLGCRAELGFTITVLSLIGKNTQRQKVTQVKKLTYFYSIKSDYKLAPYLSSIKNYGHRKLLTKYRLSEHILSVETGRHKQSWRARELRLCSHCTESLIEDELHFLTECSKYKHIRDAYFKQIALVSPEFQQTSNTEKLSYILGEKEKCIHLATQYVYSCHQMREKD